MQSSRSFSDLAGLGSMAESQGENARLKATVERLQSDRTGLEHRCKSWEDEARRVQAELDAHLVAMRQNLGGMTDQARVTQQVSLNSS